MKITALVVLLCIALLAWYHYPDPPNAAIAEPSPAGTTPALPEPDAGPERVADAAEQCAELLGTPEWDDLHKVYPGMSDDALCDFVVAPDIAKLQNVNINPEAIEDLLNRLMAEGSTDDQYFSEVPDLRYYLDPQAVELLRGLSNEQLVDKVNNQRSAEAAYLLAYNQLEDEQTFVTLMLIAASYSRKPGLMINAINGCCSYSPDNRDEERAAAIKRQALSMIARELGLPEAQQWPDLSPTDEMTAEVLEQRAAYVEELNRYSLQAYGEEWLK